MRNVIPHLRKTRPVLWLIVRQAPVDRVDSERKQSIEFCFVYWRGEKPLAQKIPVEGFEVTDIEDDAVPLRNRALIQKLRTHHREHFIRPGSRLRQSL